MDPRYLKDGTISIGAPFKDGISSLLVDVFENILVLEVLISKPIVGARWFI
jgi:hypothetical protein